MAQMKFQYHVGTVDLSTSAPSAAERCTQYGYGLIATGRQIALHFWRATPALYRDCSNRCRNRSASAGTDGLLWVPIRTLIGVVPTNERSAEPRVGKEWVRTCRSGWSPYHSIKKT